jgi:hypothetical protein
MPANLSVDSLTLQTECVARPTINLYGEDYALASLDNAELELWKAQFAELMSMIGSDERKIMLNRVAQYILGLRAVKMALGSVRFQGVNAGDTTIGMSLIRPQFMQANAVAGFGVGFCRANWNQVLTAAWADWIFNGTGVPMSAGKDFGFVITHLKSLCQPNPFVAEVEFLVGRTQLLPNDVRNIRMFDSENNIAIQPLNTMIVIPKGSFYARARSDANGTDIMPLGGLLYGLGRVLKEEVPTWIV